MYGGEPNPEIMRKYVDRERICIPQNFVGEHISGISASGIAKTFP
jgi:hypothetical protein